MLYAAPGFINLTILFVKVSVAKRATQRLDSAAPGIEHFRSHGLQLRRGEM